MHGQPGTLLQIPALIGGMTQAVSTNLVDDDVGLLHQAGGPLNVAVGIQVAADAADVQPRPGTICTHHRFVAATKQPVSDMS